MAQIRETIRLHRQVGRTEPARRTYERALGIWEAAGNRPGIALTSDNLGCFVDLLFRDARGVVPIRHGRWPSK